MRGVLSVYSKNAFKEYLLPAVNNTDYKICISKEIFQLEEELELCFEVIDNQWKIIENQQNYYVKYGEYAYQDKVLQHNDILIITTRNGQKISVIVSETERSFVVFDKYDIRDNTQISIGKNTSNVIIYDAFELVSREHGVIDIREGKVIIYDMSSNGIFINAKRMNEQYVLRFGDVINIFGLRIVYLGNVFAISVTTLRTAYIDVNVLSPHQLETEPSEITEKTMRVYEEGSYLHRAPRNIPKIVTEEVEIEAPPSPKQGNTAPLYMTIGPSVTMMMPMLLGSMLAIYSSRIAGANANAFMYTGIITAAGSAVIGTFWAISNMRYAKKIAKEEENHRFEAYGEYLIQTADSIREKYEHNTEALKGMYLEARQCCVMNKNSSLLWNRNTSHKDFLMYRLGIGSMPFQMEVKIPKERFTLINDSLSEKPKIIKNEFKTLFNVPLCVDLFKKQLIGVVGGKGKKGALTVIRDLVAQITANNCYTDVKLAFIYDENKYDNTDWSYAKWFPHVWSEDKKVRFIASNREEAGDVLFELAQIIRKRSQEEAYRVDEVIPKPYYIVIVEEQSLLEGELIAKYLYAPQVRYGFTTLLMAENYEDLPNSCEYIIENSIAYKGMYGVADGENGKINIQFDELSCGDLEKFARGIAGVTVKELENGGEIPASLTFFEMYDIQLLSELNVVDRWKKNRTYENMRALIGEKAGGNPVYLDVHEKYHGPHGLVAGTTGSGKSETLQTYILSLAVNFSPEDVGFFIIDYKGGGMANLFAGLPHMIGSISNLSGNQVRRAMVSIKSENMRRQRLFNENGVNNINLYTKLYKNNEVDIPIPHLFIIIDEFAELKREEPEFMRELISVAQVGRSLGVHLILATQKPSGTVDDNIWSNSKFKLCLRVQDRQDSNDMLHKPDAAYITQAGRCYLQVGNDEIYELFQSGFSGAAYDEAIGTKGAIAKMISLNGREALVGSRQKIKQKDYKRFIFIKALVEVLSSSIVSETEFIARYSDSLWLISFLTNVFRKISAKGIEYPESQYNRNRLEELLSLYLEIYDEDQSRDIDDIVSEIISRANIRNSKLPEVKERTQLDAVIEYLRDTAEKQKLLNNFQLWMPLLPTVLYLRDLKGYIQNSFDGHKWPEKRLKWNLEALIGLCDDPVNQAQMPVTVNFSKDGHHAVCGSIVSGKSTFLQTLVYSLVSTYTPDCLNIYGIDFSSRMLSPFNGYAHVGGILYEEDEEQIEKFFHMIRLFLEERKQLLKGGNYNQYVQVHGVCVPAIIVIIDGYANFREKTENKYENILIRLAREGVGYGVYLVVTAAGFGPSEIQAKIGDNIKTVICLEQGDKFQYADALRTMKLEVLPETGVKGRGLINVNGQFLEFQTALPIQAADDYERIRILEKYGEIINQKWNGRHAKHIPTIPENPTWGEFELLDEVRQYNADDRHLAIGYNLRNADIYAVDLSKIYTFIISGKSRTGKTNLLKIIMLSAKQKGGKIFVMDDAVNGLSKFAEKIGAACISTQKQQFEFFKELLPIFKERNIRKLELQSMDSSEEEIYEQMQSEEKIYIFVADLTHFITQIYTVTEGIPEYKGFVRNITEKGRLHNVFFFAGFNQDDYLKINGRDIYSNMIADRVGIHLGGNVSEQRIFNFDTLPFSEKSKKTKNGIGFLPVNGGDNETVEKIVIPLYKG